MSAIEQCHSAALGGHVLRCSGCARTEIAYNSRRNRHCPKCQGNAARRWLEARQADLLPVGYYHVVFTLPAAISAIAWYNKRVEITEQARQSLVCRNCSSSISSAARSASIASLSRIICSLLLCSLLDYRSPVVRDVHRIRVKHLHAG